MGTYRNKGVGRERIGPDNPTPTSEHARKQAEFERLQREAIDREQQRQQQFAAAEAAKQAKSDKLQRERRARARAAASNNAQQTTKPSQPTPAPTRAQAAKPTTKRTTTSPTHPANQAGSGQKKGPAKSRPMVAPKPKETSTTSSHKKPGVWVAALGVLGILAIVFGPNIFGGSDGTGSPSGMMAIKYASIDNGDSLGPGNAPSVAGSDAQRCGRLTTYADLVNCKGNNAQFQAAVDRHADDLRMSWNAPGAWNTVVNWSQKCMAADARAILISNRSETDQQARDLLRPTWGPAVDSMPVLPRQNGIINTMHQDVMDPFIDNTAQIRVTLVPLDAGCQRIVTSTSGIMSDCYNGWWPYVPPPVAPAPQEAPAPAPPPEAPTQEAPPEIEEAAPPPPPPAVVGVPVQGPSVIGIPIGPGPGWGGPPPCSGRRCGGPAPCRDRCGPPPCRERCGPPPCQGEKCHPQPGCKNGLCSKDPGDTLTGPNVPGQNGHVNANPGPGSLQSPGDVTRPSSPAPQQNPAPAPAQVAPGITQSPRQSAPSAPVTGSNRLGGGSSSCSPLTGCAAPGSLGGFTRGSGGSSGMPSGGGRSSGGSFGGGGGGHGHGR